MGLIVFRNLIMLFKSLFLLQKKNPWEKETMHGRLDVLLR